MAEQGAGQDPPGAGAERQKNGYSFDLTRFFGFVFFRTPRASGGRRALEITQNHDIHVAICLDYRARWCPIAVEPPP